MKVGHTIAIILTVFVVANVVGYRPYRAYHRGRRTAEDEQRRHEFLEALHQAPPIVVVGNSIADAALDEGLLAGLTGSDATCIHKGAALSAWVYMAVKNLVIPHDPKARLLVYVFTDNELTRPSGNTGGHSTPLLADVAEEHEPLVERLAFLGGLGGTAYYLHRYVPLMRSRGPAQQALALGIKTVVVGPLTGRDLPAMERSVAYAFSAEKMSPAQSTLRQREAESRMALHQEGFRGLVDASFVPPLIEICRRHGIRLVFLRQPTRRQVRRRVTATTRYDREQSAYFDERGIPFLDYLGSEELGLEDFHDYAHLNARGRERLTRHVAQRLQELL